MSRNTLSGDYAVPGFSPVRATSAAIIRAAAADASASSYMLPTTARRVVDQGSVNCCVSCALGAGMEILNASWPPLAPLFHYYVTRYERDAADPDGFLYLKDALGVLTTAGICRNDFHNPPFTSAGEASPPSSAAYQDGKMRSLAKRGFRDRYAKCNSVSVTTWARDQLKRNCPVVIGFRLPMGYPTTFLNDRFEWIDPDLPESDASHVVLAIGYSDVRGALRILDSRGPRLFERGQWWMGYRVTDSAVVVEAYSLFL